MQNLATDLTISLPQDRPGALAKVADVLAKAGINADGYAEIGRVLHLLVKDAPRAREALVTAGGTCKASSRYLSSRWRTRLERLPGCSVGFADAGMNLRFSYVAANNRLVVGVENLRAGAGLHLGGAASRP